MDELEKIKQLVESFPNHYSKMIKNNPVLHSYVSKFYGLELKEKIFTAIYSEIPHECKYCSKPTPFITIAKGYREYCDSDCQKLFLKTDNELNAIKKLNSFGNLVYISGYEGTHSKVKVKNVSCGCIFDVTYGNIFTNKNYCPTHGSQNRTEKLIKRNSLGLSEASKDKRKLTFESLREEKLANVKLKNEIIENEILLEGRDFVNSFLQEMFNQYRSKTEIVLLKLPKLHKMIKRHYGDRFGQKLYNFVHKIDSLEDHPKCLECGKIVNYGISSNHYKQFCSLNCSQNSNLTKNKMEATCIEKYGVRHPMQNKEILEKNWESQYRIKLLTLPSGKEIKLMGYEPQVLNYLLTIENYQESDFEFHAIPTFRYGGKKLYFPDFYLPDHNLIIEVKSDWTLQLSPEVIVQKRDSVESAGYEYRLIVWDDKLNMESKLV